METENYYVVRYTGPFGFIKPWTAVRDDRTFSQQFLTPSIVEGMRQKLGVSAILRHRLTYHKVDLQQERTQSRAFVETKKRQATREQSILTRGIMLNPTLRLAFTTEKEAQLAAEQHICLCRNEDVLLPDSHVAILSKADFDKLSGFELIFGESNAAIMVGYDRFRDYQPMYGTLEISGTPVSAQPHEYE